MFTLVQLIVRSESCYQKGFFFYDIGYAVKSPAEIGYVEHFIVVLQPKNSNVKFYVLAFPLVAICNAVVE